jgi:hypothetical protein
MNEDKMNGALHPYFSKSSFPVRQKWHSYSPKVPFLHLLFAKNQSVFAISVSVFAISVSVFAISVSVFVISVSVFVISVSVFVISESDFAISKFRTMLSVK